MGDLAELGGIEGMVTDVLLEVPGEGFELGASGEEIYGEGGPEAGLDAAAQADGVPFCAGGDGGYIGAAQGFLRGVGRRDGGLLE
jgi:hypothetical protein